MKLITEVVNDCNVATEINEETGDKSYFIEGIFMQGDIKNRNGRIKHLILTLFLILQLMQ